jgi:beta-phosphoglucomutase
MIKGFIFDMDGTVIDSTQSDFQAWEKMLSEHNVKLAYQEFLDFLGGKGEEIVARFLSAGKEEIKEMLRKKEQYFKEFAAQNHFSMINGVEIFLLKIKDSGYPMALATGAGKDKLDFVFSRLDFKKYFNVILTSEDVKKGKPDPEIFLKAAAKLGISPGDSMVVEDSGNGIKAARDAGAKTIAITSTHTKEDLLGADIIIDSYAAFNWQDISQFD